MYVFIVYPAKPNAQKSSMGREKTLLDISKAMVFIILSHNHFYTSGWIEGIMQASMINSSVTARPNETKSVIRFLR